MVLAATFASNATFVQISRAFLVQCIVARSEENNGTFIVTPCFKNANGSSYFKLSVGSRNKLHVYWLHGEKKFSFPQKMPRGTQI